MNRNAAVFTGLAGLLVCTSLRAEPPFESAVAPVLKTYCVSCHRGAKPKGDLALDKLVPDFDKNGEAWKRIMERMSDGSMPPNGKPRPSPTEAKAISQWVIAELTAFETKKAASTGRARLRRLNRVEYVNTIRDLLGVEVDIETLPEDGIAGGFDNVDAALDLSPNLLERYLETADAALDKAFVQGAKPQVTKKHVDLAPLGKLMTKANRPVPRLGKSTVVRENEVVYLGRNDASKPIVDLKVSQTGLYRIRVSANSVRHDKGMTLIVYAGNYGMGVQGLLTRPIGMYDVADTPTVLEFTERLMAKESLRIDPYGLPNLYTKMPDDYSGPGLVMRWVEVEGPLIEVWPPAATTRLLAGIDPAKGTLADAAKVLRQFAPRAFRRPVTDAELAPFLNIVKMGLDKGYTFEAALRVGLKGVLCSPHFLYLPSSPGKLNDFDLATRLSYFLWSTTADDVLADLASKGELGKPEIVRQQVERMLKDSRVHAFTENFTGQWLSLRNLKFTVPDKKLYPDFDEYLELSMPRETHLFFEELLRDNRSVLEFVHADWSMLNERLAMLYGISGVNGSEFRKVSLPPGSHRGGVLTQSAVLRVTANGTNTSPVTRGTWVLDRILGTPAPPPPQDVPAIEPDIRGAKTLREQLARHRQLERCAGCHAKIDPAGNALENFDVIGGWRDFYRVIPDKGITRVKVVIGRGKAMPVGKGPNVNAADELADGRKFTNVDDFKKLILENRDQFARNLTRKLLVYATGHGIEISDHEVVEKILADVRLENYGFRSMIHAIVQSPTFRSK